MLKLRVITAFVLLTVFLPLLVYSNPDPFIAVSLILISAAAWEWGRLNGLPAIISVLTSIGFALVMGGLWFTNGLPQNGWYGWLTAVLWLAGVPWVLTRGVGAWGRIPRGLRLVFGLLVLGVAWGAMAHARSIGVNFLLSIFSLVWMADIAAYFGGRTWGRLKLAPTISPGKSREGAIAGWLGVVVLAIFWVWIDVNFEVDSKSVFSQLLDRHQFLAWIGISCLVVASVLGDLFESLVKRSAGFKDSSNLLPGHGGVLDRVDALLPVLPLAMVFVSI